MSFRAGFAGKKRKPGLKVHFFLAKRKTKKRIRTAAAFPKKVLRGLGELQLRRAANRLYWKQEAADAFRKEVDLDRSFQQYFFEGVKPSRVMEYVEKEKEHRRKFENAEVGLEKAKERLGIARQNRIHGWRQTARGLGASSKVKKRLRNWQEIRAKKNQE